MIKPQDLWNNTLWTDETKVELLNAGTLFGKNQTASEQKHLILTVMLSGSGVMIWTTGPGHLAGIVSTVMISFIS